MTAHRPGGLSALVPIDGADSLGPIDKVRHSPSTGWRRDARDPEVGGGAWRDFQESTDGLH